MKIAILGYGKMGKTIEKLATHKGHEIVFTSGSNASEGDLTTADVAIEFSTPEAAVANITSCFTNGIPVVSGTTGWLAAYDEMLKLCKSSNGSFIYASNFSIGVNLFFAMNEFAAKLMEPWKDYKVSIEEIHHTEKKDAPSGTAITIAEGLFAHSVKGSFGIDLQRANEVSISSKRIADVKGTHIIKYDSEIDSIHLKHEAHSRDGFALGAILAAEWLQNKKGVYSMKDVLKIK